MRDFKFYLNFNMVGQKEPPTFTVEEVRNG